MAEPVLVLGGGFGGLEFCTSLSEKLGGELDITLIDKSDTFTFGFSKLDVLFGRTSVEAVQLPYAEFTHPGVSFRQETVTVIDPVARRVTTNAGTYEADTLVIALGADYDMAATPGLAEDNEFYTPAGAARLGALLPQFKKGRALVAVCGAPFKCPPAPSETALLLHDYLSTRGVRDACDITLVLPLETPVPPSPQTSQALMDAFAERRIHFIGDREVSSLDPHNRVALLDDGQKLHYDLLFGVPKQSAPQVLKDAGMVEDGYVPVNPKTLATKFPHVYAIGDCARQGTPKAGVFAEGAARVLASHVGGLRSGEEPLAHQGMGSCYIEFGAGRIGKVDIDFLSGPKPTGAYHAPSVALRAEKDHFGSSRRARWFHRKESARQA